LFAVTLRLLGETVLDLVEPPGVTLVIALVQ
jgi:hypothetical protein